MAPDVAIDRVNIVHLPAAGPRFVGEMFQRKFGHEAPAHGHHIICFYRHSWQHFVPLGYLNLLPHETVMLVGGGMTDGSAFRFVRPEDSAAIREAGGVLFLNLRYAFHTFADACEAFFGYAADPRALEVDFQAGFEPTPYDKLIVHFHRPLSEDRRQELIEMMRDFGPF